MPCLASQRPRRDLTTTCWASHGPRIYNQCRCKAGGFAEESYICSCIQCPGRLRLLAHPNCPQTHLLHWRQRPEVCCSCRALMQRPMLLQNSICLWQPHNVLCIVSLEHLASGHIIGWQAHFCKSYASLLMFCSISVRPAHSLKQLVLQDDQSLNFLRASC